MKIGINLMSVKYLISYKIKETLIRIMNMMDYMIGSITNR